MNETIKIRLPDETVNYLQRLDYEIGGLQVLHTHALNAGVPLETRMEVRREFQEKFAEYQLAKQEMWAQYRAQYPNCRWWVDFQEGVLHIRETKQSPITACGGTPFQKRAEGEVDDHA